MKEYVGTIVSHVLSWSPSAVVLVTTRGQMLEVMVTHQNRSSRHTAHWTDLTPERAQSVAENLTSAIEQEEKV